MSEFKGIKCDLCSELHLSMRGIDAIRRRYFIETSIPAEEKIVKGMLGKVEYPDVCKKCADELVGTGEYKYFDAGKEKILHTVEE